MSHLESKHCQCLLIIGEKPSLNEVIIIGDTICDQPEPGFEPKSV